MPKITLKKVSSSQINAIGHDPESNTMAVQFLSRGEPSSTYHYSHVNAEQFAEFEAAPSIGSHFGKHFKNNSAHPYVKITDTVTA